MQLSGPGVILALKVAVAAVTLILAASLVAVCFGRYRLHGRLNIAFFTLTLAAVLGLEVVVRFVDPNLFDYIDANPDWRRAMRVHLGFSIPSLLVLPIMLLTGLRRRRVHPWLAWLFLPLWAGTFVTGVFLLPHSSP